MPYINIQVTDEGVTNEQKSALIEQTSDVLFRVLGKDPSITFVVIEEVALENWGFGGRSVADIRKQAQG